MRHKISSDDESRLVSGKHFNLKRPYRPEIDGLRSLAILSVIAYHAQFSGIAGGFVGVDIFFVISGYLITGILMSELQQKGQIDFLTFWARRTRRLMPSALLVILVSVCAAFFLLSDLQTLYAGRDAIFAAAYLTNWQNLVSAVNYFDDESGTGLFLHYWSLAVEEQFYLFLSLLFFVAVFIARKVGDKLTASHVIIASFVVFGVASLAANLIMVREAQPIAFFGTHARIWQLALGGGICLLERSGWAPKMALRQLSAWIGLAMMLLAIITFNTMLAYPGSYAIVPSVGASLFILSGINSEQQINRKIIPLAFFSITPLIGIGMISYALYLWHWPVFQLYKAHFGSWALNDIALAAGITLGLSLVSYYTIENPIRFNRWLGARSTLSLVAGVMMTIATCGVSYVVMSEKSNNFIVLADGTKLNQNSVRLDLPRIYEENCHTDQPSIHYQDCVYGNPLSERKIFLIGDSHAAHWFPAIEYFATMNNFALYSRTKSACVGIEVKIFYPDWKREYTECEEWQKRVYDEVSREKPDIIVIGNSSKHTAFIAERNERATLDESLARLSKGEQRSVQKLVDHGAKVVLMKDMPFLPEDPLDCLIGSSKGGLDCQWPVTESLQANSAPWSNKQDYDPQGSVMVLDLTDKACREGFCYASASDFVLMRDRHHITAEFAKRLAHDVNQKLKSFIHLR